MIIINLWTVAVKEGLLSGVSYSQKRYLHNGATGRVRECVCVVCMACVRWVYVQARAEPGSHSLSLTVTSRPCLL